MPPFRRFRASARAAIAAAAASCLLPIAAPLAAQGQQPPPGQENNAGFGGLYARFDLEAMTGNDGHVGCAQLGDSLFVSARDPDRAGNHVVYRLSFAGAVTATFAQPAAHSITTFGMRDLCTDGAAIAGGSEAGISILQPNGTLATHWHGQPVTQPITGAWLTALGVPRGLAWDPAANGGAGLFFAVNLDSPIYAFDAAGTVVATWPNGGWSGHGLALDPTTGNLWIDAAPDRGDLAELDRATFTLTGRRIPQSREAGRSAGLSEVTGAPGTFAPWGTTLNFVSLVQGPDSLAVHRVHQFAAKAGWDEVRLEVGVNGGTREGGGITFGAGDVLDLCVVDPMGVTNGLPCWTILNVMPDAAADGLTDLSPFLPFFGILTEHRTRNIANVLFPSADFWVFDQTVGAPASIAVPAAFAVAPGDVIRAQALHPETLNPQFLDSTNESWWLGGMPQVGIAVEAVGATNFRSDQGRGFWRVHHLGGALAITSVTFDWDAATWPEHATTVFDIDQTELGDRHDGGNCAANGFRGTYRRNSDTACGLDYAFAGNHRPPFAGPGESAGFTIDSGTAEAARRLTYRFAGGLFTGGRTFEFDCDTDGGVGVRGGAMAGLWVTVTVAGGAQFSGRLVADPHRPMRAWLHL